MANDAMRTRLLQNIHALQQDYREAEKALEDMGDLAPHMYDLWTELGVYRAGDDPHKAVYIIARCSKMLDRFGLTYMAIQNYREAQQKLEEYDMRKAIENG